MKNEMEPEQEKIYLSYLAQTQKEVAEEVNNNKSVKVFLISLKAGGTGLNLISADVVIHYDPWWNVSSENQETDRAYRIGQKNSVQVYKLITSNSIEEKINKMQERKEKPSSDRLEYTFSNGLGATEKLWGLNEIEETYKNIEIQENEEGIPELGFKDLKVAEKFVSTMSILSRLYRRDKTVFSMQLLADIMKKMSDENMITLRELYELSEKEVIEKIEHCGDESITKCFNIWKNATKINTSETLPTNKYYVSIEKMKVRYINPLVQDGKKYARIYDISKKAREDIEKAINYKTAKYIYLDF